MKLNYSYLSINNNYYSNFAQIPKVIEHNDENQECEKETKNIGGINIEVCKTETNNDKDISNQSNSNVFVSKESEDIEIPKYQGKNTSVVIEVKTPSYESQIVNISSVKDLEYEIVDKVIPLKDDSKNNTYLFYDQKKDINCNGTRFIGPSLTYKKCIAKGYEEEKVSIDKVKGWHFSGQGGTKKYIKFRTELNNDKILVFGCIDENKEDLLVEINKSKQGSIEKIKEEIEPKINFYSLYDNHISWNTYFKNIGHYSKYSFTNNIQIEEEDLLKEEDTLLQEENLLEEEELIEKFSEDRILNLNNINKTICSSDNFPNHDVNPDHSNWKTWIKNKNLINPYNVCGIVNAEKPKYEKTDGTDGELVNSFIIQPIENKILYEENVENQVKFTFKFSDTPFIETTDIDETILVEKPSYNYDFTKKPVNNFIVEENFNDIAQCISTSFSENLKLNNKESQINFNPYTNANNGFSLEFYINWSEQDLDDVNIFDLAFSKEHSANLIHQVKKATEVPLGYCSNGVTFGKYCCANSCGVCGGLTCASRGEIYDCCPNSITRQCDDKTNTSCIIPEFNSYLLFNNLTNQNDSNENKYELNEENMEYSYGSNKWTHVVMSINKDNILYIYFNGNRYALEGKEFGKLKSGFRDQSVIGKDAKMDIKYFRIWNNHSLNESEVKKLFNNKEVKINELDIFKTIKPTFVNTPTYNFEFRKDENNIIYDNINRLSAILNSGCRSTKNDGLIFDGLTSYVKFDENLKLNSQNGFTIEFYARIEKTPNTNSDKKQIIFLFSKSMNSKMDFMLSQSDNKLNLTNEDLENE